MKRTKDTAQALFGVPRTALLPTEVDKEMLEFLSGEVSGTSLGHVKFEMISRHSNRNVK